MSSSLFFLLQRQPAETVGDKHTFWKGFFEHLLDSTLDKALDNLKCKSWTALEEESK